MMAKEQLVTLHRHWMWCNIIKHHFDAEVQKQGPDVGKKNLAGTYCDYYGAYMAIWYGLLFSVLEVLKKKDISIPTIDEDIRDVYEPLRLFRNAVFHPQGSFWSPKLLEIYKDPLSAAKIRRVHSGLGEFFLEKVGQLAAEVDSESAKDGVTAK